MYRKSKTINPNHNILTINYNDEKTLETKTRSEYNKILYTNSNKEMELEQLRKELEALRNMNNIGKLKPYQPLNKIPKITVQKDQKQDESNYFELSQSKSTVKKSKGNDRIIIFD